MKSNMFTEQDSNIIQDTQMECQYSMVTFILFVFTFNDRFYHASSLFLCLSIAFAFSHFVVQLNLPHLNQRRISMVKYLGLLYNYCLVDSPVIFKTLYSLLTFGVSLDSKFSLHLTQFLWISISLSLLQSGYKL